MTTTLPDIARLKPSGGKRSSKREQIVNVFLRQEGHLSADDLVDLIRREDHRISRATVYRTLQWMVDAGIARKVDFGEGRFRFEHSYRHPRHFHLICKNCHRSFEFLSSDIEGIVEEVSAARNFAAAQSVVQIYGTCEECRTGRTASPQGHTDLLFARGVQNVRELVTWLLRDSGDWSRPQIDAVIKSGQRIDAKIKQPIPVYWVYITGWGVNGAPVQFRDDIYDRDGVGTLALR